MSTLQLLTFLLPLMLLLLPQQAESQSPPFRTAIYEMKVTEQEKDRLTETMSKVWINYEERKYCIETDMITLDGKGTKYITIHSDGTVFLLQAETKTAQEIPSSSEEKRLFDWGEMPDHERFEGTQVGTDTVAGLETVVYEYIKLEDKPRGIVKRERRDGRKEDTIELEDITSQSAIQSNVRQWIWKGTDFPLKTIVDYGSKKVTTEVLHIAVDVDVPERVFRIPKDYTLKKNQQ